MDTAQQSTISEAEIRRIAGAAALWLPESHRPDAASRAFFRIRDKAVDQEWESDKHRLNWAKMVARNAVRDYAAAMHLRQCEELHEAIADAGPLPSDMAEAADLREHRKGRFRMAANRLENKDRGLAWSHVARGETLKSIGQRIGVSESRICQRMKLVKARLMAGISDSRLAMADWAMNRLTSRRLEVLKWLAAGKTDREIALILGISHRTVEIHVRRIIAELGVENRWSAALVYLQASDKHL